MLTTPFQAARNKNSITSIFALPFHEIFCGTVPHARADQPASVPGPSGLLVVEPDDVT
jgi:hypothetical protein